MHFNIVFKIGGGIYNVFSHFCNVKDFNICGIATIMNYLRPKVNMVQFDIYMIVN